MSWSNLPADYDGPAWVWCPNSLYDPKEGHRLYNEYLGFLEDSEPMGFDGVCVNEASSKCLRQHAVAQPAAGGFRARVSSGDSGV